MFGKVTFDQCVNVLERYHLQNPAHFPKLKVIIKGLLLHIDTATITSGHPSKILHHICTHSNPLPSLANETLANT